VATAHKNLSAVDLDALPSGKNCRIGLVVSQWNKDLTAALYQGAVDLLMAKGVTQHNLMKLNVPGAVELTYGAKKLCQAQPAFDAIIAIGVVIEGETRHFDFVCQSVTQGITALNVQYDTPVIFCVLTDRNREQSLARSGGKHGNKGTEAGATALLMAHLSWLRA